MHLSLLHGPTSGCFVRSLDSQNSVEHAQSMPHPICREGCEERPLARVTCTDASMPRVSGRLRSSFITHHHNKEAGFFHPMERDALALGA
jgi:hypothetical protein